MLKITDLVIDPSCLGKQMWLVDVLPTYVYANGQRTDTIAGYRYIVALPDKGLEKITVKIDGDQRISAPNGYVAVHFDDLVVRLSWYRGEYVVVGHATDIHTAPANTKTVN